MTKRLLQRLLALAVTLALLGWFFADARWDALAEALARLGAAEIALIASGFLLSYLLRGLRIYDEFRGLVSPQHGYGAFLRVMLLHNAAVNVLPFRGGEVALPLLLHRRFGVAPARAIGSLLWLRLQDAFVVAALAVLVWPGLATELRVLGLAGLLVVAWGLPRYARRTPQEQTPNQPTPKPRTPGKAEFGDRLARTAQKLISAFGEASQHARRGWLWTLANWSVKLAAQAFLLALLLEATLKQGMAGALGAELAAILPIQGVAGFGTFEAGAAAALRTTGIPLTEGLLAALALHLAVIGLALTAATFAWLWPTAPHAAAASPLTTSTTPVAPVAPIPPSTPTTPIASEFSSPPPPASPLADSAKNEETSRP